MLPKDICFVDIETTGISAHYNRIIEIGILKVENGKLVKKYSQLINPESRIDPFITSLTGISDEMVENAPTFDEIKDEVYDLLKDSVFVAHNVRFDYGFIRNEFKRHGIKISLKHFCTVKLAKQLYPHLKRHNLDSIIENFNIKCNNRHRAFDDARVLFDFYNQLAKKIKKEIFEKAVNIALKRPTIPLNIKQEELDKLPENPGVYIFYGKNSEILYIGKSKNIRDRVLSHFSNDYLSSTDMKISKEIYSIETHQTSGELGALLLESTLIKKHQPLFNRQLRHARKMVIALKTFNDMGFNSLEMREMESISIDNLESVIGVFKSRKQLKDTLYMIAKDHGLCPRLLNLEKTNRHCFSYQLGQCKGACVNKELNLSYNSRFEEAFYKHKIKSWKFNGPIIIKEASEGFVVDKWCLLGKISADQGIVDITNEYNFDLDTYKIINRFLFKQKTSLQIQSIKI